MKHRILRRLHVAAATLPLALWLLVPAPVAASCAMPIPIEEAIRAGQVVITGTVTATENMGRWATVEVHEIWKGPDLPATVAVLGGPGPGTASSIDRSFNAGARYLFVLAMDEQGQLHDNSCSATAEMAAGENQLRPKDFRTPVAAETTDTGPDLGGVIGAGAVALVVAAALLVVGLMARGRQTT